MYCFFLSCLLWSLSSKKCAIDGWCIFFSLDCFFLVGLLILLWLFLHAMHASIWSGDFIVCSLFFRFNSIMQNSLSILSILSMSFQQLRPGIWWNEGKKGRYPICIRSISKMYYLFIDHLAWKFIFFLFQFNFLCSIHFLFKLKCKPPYTLHYILNIQWSSRWLSNICHWRI